MSTTKYDFYFSSKHSKYLDSLADSYDPPTRCFVLINDRWCEYTETITHGKKPLTSNWDDLVLISIQPWDFKKIRTEERKVKP